MGISAYAIGAANSVAPTITIDAQVQFNRGCYFPTLALLHDAFPIHSGFLSKMSG